MKRLRKVTNIRLNPFKEEIDNKMKGKFKLLGHIGVALFLVSALMLAFMPAAPVQAAATEVTDVWVEFAATGENATADTGHDNIYYIHFKPTTALSRGVDTVTVTWPDGSSAMGGDGTTNYAFTIDDDTGTTDATLCLSDGEVWFSTDYGTTVDTTAASPSWTQCTLNATSAGYRTKITTPIDIAAGQDVWVKIDSEADNTTLGIETPADGYEGTSFKVKVATSQDITPVLSSTFALGDSTEVCSVLTAEVITSIAGAAAQYTFTFTPGNAVSANTGKVTIKFPVGTTVPSISAINIQFSTNAGTDYSTCAEDPVVDSGRRLITAVTPVLLDADADNRMKILSAAGVTNPTIAAPTDNTYRAMIRTTADDQWYLGTNYAITEGSSSKVAIADGEIGLGSVYPYSDSATMVNMLSGYIYVYIADQYGNTVDTSSSSVTVTPSTSSTSGAFYKNASTTPSGGAYSTITTITVDNEDPTDDGQQVYYCDSAAGTYTLTFSATGYTSATWTVTVAPVISLYDANDSLVSTYGATSTSPVAELGGTGGDITTQMYGGNYITNAISAAMTGDTIKLGDGIYELDAYINLNKKVTLTSVNGAAYTTIRPFDEPLTTPYINHDFALIVGAQGTAANPVVIDGLTFTRLRAGDEFDNAVFNNGYNYVTVQNCVFNYIKPEHYADHESGSVVGFYTFKAGSFPHTVVAITSGTISNNTFNNCCTFEVTEYGEQAAVINVFVKGDGDPDYAISGVTVSGNTLTDCNGIGIAMKGHYNADGTTFKCDATDNTLTNSVYPISVQGYTDGVNVLRNTVTGGYQTGLWVEPTEHASLVIKNNTITGTAGAGCTQSTYAVSCAIGLWDDGADTDDVPSVNTVQYNDIYDNDATYSIYAKSDIGDMGGSDDPDAQDCQYNYFGDATGPYYSALTGATVTKSNPNGTGKQITDLVTYYSWLYKPRADVVADNVSYQTSTMKLVLGGWNTLSTPVKLIEAANAIDELISADDMSIGYYYDGGWQPITTGYVLSPCNAVYIKMKSTASTAYVQFKFDAGAYTTPSKDLAAGWNLISLASLDASKNVNDTMACVDLTADYLPGWSQVVSPSINATQRDIYYATETAWSESAGQDVPYTMQPGLGYWCYMQNAATLAGFEITPIVPDLD